MTKRDLLALWHVVCGAHARAVTNGTHPEVVAELSRLCTLTYTEAQKAKE